MLVKLPVGKKKGTGNFWVVGFGESGCGGLY